MASKQRQRGLLRQILKKDKHFGQLTEPVLGGVLDSFEQIAIQEGHVLMRQGDIADSVYVLVEGRCEKLRRNKKDGKDVPSAFVQNVVLGVEDMGRTRSYSVVAQTKCTIHRLNSDAFYRVFQTAAPAKRTQNALAQLRASVEQHQALDQYLKSEFFFSTLVSSNLGELVRAFEKVEVGSGSAMVLFQQGEPGDALYVVAQGQCTVFSDDFDTSDIDSSQLRQQAVESGSGIGIESIQESGPRTYSAVAASGTVLWKLEKDKYDMVVAKAERSAGISSSYASSPHSISPNAWRTVGTAGSVDSASESVPSPRGIGGSMFAASEKSFVGVTPRKIETDTPASSARKSSVKIAAASLVTGSGGNPTGCDRCRHAQRKIEELLSENAASYTQGQEAREQLEIVEKRQMQTETLLAEMRATLVHEQNRRAEAHNVTRVALASLEKLRPIIIPIIPEDVGDLFLDLESSVESIARVYAPKSGSPIASRKAAALALATGGQATGDEQLFDDFLGAADRSINSEGPSQGAYEALTALKDQLESELRLANRIIGGLRDESEELRNLMTRTSADFEQAQMDAQTIAERNHELEIMVAELRERTETLQTGEETAQLNLELAREEISCLMQKMLASRRVDDTNPATDPGREMLSPPPPTNSLHQVISTFPGGGSPNIEEDRAVIEDQLARCKADLKRSKESSLALQIQSEALSEELHAIRNELQSSKKLEETAQIALKSAISKLKAKESEIEALRAGTSVQEDAALTPRPLDESQHAENFATTEQLLEQISERDRKIASLLEEVEDLQALHQHITGALNQKNEATQERDGIAQMLGHQLEQLAAQRDDESQQWRGLQGDLVKEIERLREKLGRRERTIQKQKTEMFELQRHVQELEQSSRDNIEALQKELEREVEYSSKAQREANEALELRAKAEEDAALAVDQLAEEKRRSSSLDGGESSRTTCDQCQHLLKEIDDRVEDLAAMRVSWEQAQSATESHVRSLEDENLLLREKVAELSAHADSDLISNNTIPSSSSSHHLAPIMETEDFVITRAGVGLRFAKPEDQILVSEVLPHGPAKKSEAFNSGDILVAVDGLQTDGLELGDLNSLIPGDAGTEVVLTCRRDGVDFIVPLVRGEISMDPAPTPPLVSSAPPTQATTAPLHSQIPRLKFTSPRRPKQAIASSGTTDGSANQSDEILSAILERMTELVTDGEKLGARPEAGSVTVVELMQELQQKDHLLSAKSNTIMSLERMLAGKETVKKEEEKSRKTWELVLVRARKQISEKDAFLASSAQREMRVGESIFKDQLARLRSENAATRSQLKAALGEVKLLRDRETLTKSIVSFSSSEADSDAAVRERAELLSRIRDLESDLSRCSETATAQVCERFCGEVSRLSFEVEAWSKDRANLLKQLENLNEMKADLEGLVRAEEQRGDEKELEISTLQGSLESLEEEKRIAEESVREREAESERLQAKVSFLESDLQQSTVQLQGLAETLASKDAELCLLVADKALAAEERAESERIVAELRVQLRDSSLLLRAKEGELSMIQSLLSGSANSLVSTERALEKEMGQLEELVTKISTNLEEKKAEVSRLNEALKQSEDSETELRGRLEEMEQLATLNSKDIEIELTKLTRSLNEKKEMEEEMEAEIMRLREALKQSKGLVKSSQVEGLAAMNTSTKKMEKEMEKLKKAKEKREEELLDLVEQSNLLLRNVNDSKQALEIEFQQLKESSEETSIKNAAVEAELQRLREHLEKSDLMAEVATKREKDLEQTVSELEEKLQISETDSATLRSQLVELQDRRDSTESQQLATTAEPRNDERKGDDQTEKVVPKEQAEIMEKMLAEEQERLALEATFLRETVTEQASSLDTKTAIIAELEMRLSQLDIAVQTAAETETNLRSQLVQISVREEELLAQISIRDGTISDFTAEMEKATAREEALMSKLAVLRDEYESLERDHGVLREGCALSADRVLTLQEECARYLGMLEVLRDELRLLETLSAQGDDLLLAYRHFLYQAADIGSLPTLRLNGNPFGTDPLSHQKRSTQILLDSDDDLEIIEKEIAETERLRAYAISTDSTDLRQTCEAQLKELTQTKLEKEIASLRRIADMSRSEAAESKSEAAGRLYEAEYAKRECARMEVAVRSSEKLLQEKSDEISMLRTECERLRDKLLSRNNPAGKATTRDPEIAEETSSNKEESSSRTAATPSSSASTRPPIPKLQRLPPHSGAVPPSPTVDAASDSNSSLSRTLTPNFFSPPHSNILQSPRLENISPRLWNLQIELSDHTKCTQELERVWAAAKKQHVSHKEENLRLKSHYESQLKYAQEKQAEIETRYHEEKTEWENIVDGLEAEISILEVEGRKENVALRDSFESRLQFYKSELESTEERLQTQRDENTVVVKRYESVIQDLSRQLQLHSHEIRPSGLGEHSTSIENVGANEKENIHWSQGKIIALESLNRSMLQERAELVALLKDKDEALAVLKSKHGPVSADSSPELQQAKKEIEAIKTFTENVFIEF